MHCQAVRGDTKAPAGGGSALWEPNIKPSGDLFPMFNSDVCTVSSVKSLLFHRSLESLMLNICPDKS
jgi:hypothetical protein